MIESKISSYHRRQRTPGSRTAHWILVCPRWAARLRPRSSFRTTFGVDFPLWTALLHVTALGLYECEFKGRVVGDHVFAPGWTDYRQRVYYQSLEIPGLLKAGDNALGVIT
jgi:alpha-L-rhamnosidase